MSSIRPYDRRHDHSRDSRPTADRFPKRPAVHAPERFDAGEVLKRTGFRLANEGRSTRDDLGGIGNGLARLGAGDFTSAGGNLLVTVLGGILGLILLDLLLSKSGSSITAAAVKWTGGAISRVVSPTDPLTSPGAGTPPSVSVTTPAPPPGSSAPAGGGGGGAYRDPLPGAAIHRVDQGLDLQGTPGQSVLAIGAAHIDAIKSDPGGFGTAVYYTLLSGPRKGQQLYVGHAQAVVTAGQTVAAGSPIARLLAKPLGNATQPGWTEIGFARGGAPTGAGAAFKAFFLSLLGGSKTN